MGRERQAGLRHLFLGHQKMNPTPADLLNAPVLSLPEGIVLLSADEGGTAPDYDQLEPLERFAVTVASLSIKAKLDRGIYR
jgi:hypothetical protein